MLKMSGLRLVLLVSVSVLFVGSGCSRREAGSRIAVSEGSVSGRLVWPKLLEQAKLEKVWEEKLPIKKNESLERLFILGDRIYALSDRNYIVSLDRGKGSFVFSRPFASAESAVLGLRLYADELLSIVGNRLVEVDAEFGTELGSKRLAFGVTCPAARNRSCFYVAGSDRRLHRFRAADKVELPPVAAENDSLITWIVADGNSVVFGTEMGNVISIAAESARRLWQFDAADAIVGPIVKDGGSLFAASKDTYVYKLDMDMGTPPLWKYQTGAILDRGPRVTRGVVYQYVHNKGLTAIDKKSGKFMWTMEGGLDLLAEGDGKAYVIKKGGELVVMDNKRKRRLYSVNFAGVSRYAANVTDSSIYVADEAGRIACLRPID